MNHSFVGTWSLVRCEHAHSNGELEYPWGEDAVGQIIYTSEGSMSAFVSRAHRARFQNPGLFEGGDQEKKGAVEGFLAYCGRYRIDGNKVIHVIQLSLFPNWEATEQPRSFEFSGNRLKLTSDPFPSDGGKLTTVATITWQRTRIGTFTG